MSFYNKLCPRVTMKIFYSSFFRADEYFIISPQLGGVEVLQRS